jgi:two-component system chemotaxis sensor kinase CheA
LLIFQIIWWWSNKAFSDLGKGSIFELVLPKKTNIKNISDDKVSISSKDEDVVIEDIVLFDIEDINIKEEKNIKEKNILILNNDYISFFPIAVALKKENFILTYCKSFQEAYIELKQKYDLVVVFDNNFDLDILDFIEYCEDKRLKKIIITSNVDIDNNDYLEKELVKNELFNKIVNHIGR